MPRMQIEIPHETWVQLMQLAMLERRPTRQQAEVLLIRSVSESYVPMLRQELGDLGTVDEEGREPSALPR